MHRRSLVLVLTLGLVAAALAATTVVPVAEGAQLAGRGVLDPLGERLAGRGVLDPLGERLAGRGVLDPLGGRAA